MASKNNEDWITMNGTHILVDKDNKEASIEKFLNKHGKSLKKIYEKAKEEALKTDNKGMEKRLSLDELKEQGFNIKHPDYYAYDTGSEYSLSPEMIEKIKNKKVALNDTIKIKRIVEFADWSQGGDSGKKIIKGNPVKTMAIEQEIPVRNLNNMSRFLRDRLLKGETVTSQNEKPVLNQLGMGFKTDNGFVFSYK